MPKELRNFNRSLPMTLLRAREAVMKKFTPSLKENGLTSQQWRVIRALMATDGLEATELSAKCHLLMPSLSRIISHLEKKGIIKRRIVENDLRRSTVWLTQDGRDLFDIVSPKSIERYEHIERKFGNDNLDSLYELLDELIDVLEDDAPTPSEKKKTY